MAFPKIQAADPQAYFTVFTQALTAKAFLARQLSALAHFTSARKSVTTLLLLQLRSAGKNAFQSLLSQTYQ